VGGDHEGGADDEMLREFLRGQRESVLAIVDGLDEDDWHRSVVPTAGRRPASSSIWGAPSGTGSKALWRASSRSCPATSTRICRL